VKQSEGTPLDATNDPSRKSWVSSANRPHGDFPIQNLPIAVFRRQGASESFRGGIAIGDQILDLEALAATGAYRGDAARALEAAARSTLNQLMGLGPPGWSALRQAVFEGLLEGSALQPTFQRCLVAQAEAEYSVPAQIGDFTDFYSSIYHATAVGRLFRPDNPLTPNYTWMPIGYHGRSSSIGVTEQAFHRPRGQRLPPGESQPVVAPSARLDYELELGVFVGAGNSLGSPVPIAGAESHIFGLSLLNDWSARDIQAWEYQPLGPFLAKNFATTLSPWIVSLQALAPFRVPYARPAGSPAPLGYLASESNDAAGGLDIRLEVFLETASMRARREPPQRLSSTSFRHSYWTLAQLIAHHTINGCNLRPGDLLGTGTQSGPTAGEAGSLVELTAGGKQPIRVGTTEQRTFLEDGDTVIFRAGCARPGARSIGFGEARGRVLPPIAAETGRQEPV
jgi:fumarylacetoacetase